MHLLLLFPVNKKKTTEIPWTNPDYIELTNKRNLCKDPQELRDLNKKVKTMRNKLKNQFYAQKAQAINNAKENRDIEEEFRLAKNYTLLKPSQQQTISDEKLTEHFKNHLKQKHVEQQPEVQNPEEHPHVIPDDIYINCDSPTREEVSDTIRHLKNGRCQGTDEIYAEQLKYNHSNNFLTVFTLLITMIWNTCLIPPAWLISSITCLYKNKGSRSEANNYRGLSIMATCSKVLTALIIARIRNAYEKLLLGAQYGFRCNRSTTDAIYILRTCVDNSSDTLFCCFIDLKAAYDWIDRDMLFKVLEIRLGSSILIDILKALYTGTTAAIRGTKTFLKLLQAVDRVD